MSEKEFSVNARAVIELLSQDTTFFEKLILGQTASLAERLLNPDTTTLKLNTIPGNSCDTDATTPTTLAITTTEVVVSKYVLNGTKLDPVFKLSLETWVLARLDAQSTELIRMAIMNPKMFAGLLAKNKPEINVRRSMSAIRKLENLHPLLKSRRN